MQSLKEGAVWATLLTIGVWSLGRPSLRASSPKARGSVPATSRAIGAVRAVDARIEAGWTRKGVRPADPADDLTVLRRLSLALHGTIPSLEEIRTFEADRGPRRLDRWARRLLDDDRFSAYFAERWARAYVGTERAPFLVFRRDRFVAWLRTQLRDRRPYDDIVRAMVADEGLWTGRPSTNFVTHTIVDGRVDRAALTSRTVRSFLGQRIDCAECHDHPYDVWTQDQFAHLAAFYAQTQLGPGGVRDTGPTSTTTAEVPFGAEWMPATGRPRRRLAGWITHPDNARFTRATVNRTWALLFGRPFRAPVDDLPDPDPTKRDVLDILGDDFRDHDYDLRRLVRNIVATRHFRQASMASDGSDPPASARAVFPLTRLRPEQVVGALLQAASIRTIDRDSHWLVRGVRLIRERDFVREYGDRGADELEQQSGTIPQALLRMNGKLFQELIDDQPFGSIRRLAGFSGSDEACLEATYLTFLTRRPSSHEKARFLPLLARTAGDERARRLEDIAWALVNSPEFSWNH